MKKCELFMNILQYFEDLFPIVFAGVFSNNSAIFEIQYKRYGLLVDKLIIIRDTKKYMFI